MLPKLQIGFTKGNTSQKPVGFGSLNDSINQSYVEYIQDAINYLKNGSLDWLIQQDLTR